MLNAKNVLVASAAIACLIVSASDANATVYTYSADLSVSQVDVARNIGPEMASTITINTGNDYGSIVGTGANGSAINALFIGDFSQFTGGSSPVNMTDILIEPGSTISYNGSTYTDSTPSSMQEMLLLGQDTSNAAIANFVNLWADWTSPTCAGGNCILLGDTTGLITASSTTSSTSGGGTAVPEPGMVGLMALGITALVMRRRFGLAGLAAA